MCGARYSFTTDVIINIVSVGVRDVWDIEVDEDHSYVAHGLVHHNSSRDPNLQNIPNKGGGLIKRAYVSRFGEDGVLLQADFSQVELRIAGCYYNEPTMVQAYLDEQDLHTLTGQAIYVQSTSGKKPADYLKLDKKTQKGWRTRAKRTNFGIIYGIGPPGLQSTLKKDGVFVTMDECKALVSAFFKARPGLKRGIERTQGRVAKSGYLESFTGRRRRVPEVFCADEQLVARALRQSINFPIQSGASDCTLMSLVLIRREMKRRGLKSQIILTVHDSIVFDCVVDEFLEVAQLAKEIMENLPKLSEQVLPGVKWDWLTVPLVADFEVGPNWGQMVDFNPFEISDEAPDEPLWKDEDGKQVPARDPKTIDEIWEIMEWRLAA